MNKHEQINAFLSELKRIVKLWQDKEPFSAANWDCILNTAIFNMSLDIENDIDLIESYYYQNSKNIIYVIQNTLFVKD
jgi:hypothetical protein